MRLVQRAARALGYQISRIRPVPTVPAVRPGFVDGVFGHRLYQNVSDVAIDFSPLAGLTLDDIGGRIRDGELELLRREVRPGTSVVDVGANIGFLSLMFAKLTGPTGKVFAFEPGPTSFALLSLNVLINDYKNVIAEKKAVSASTGGQTLYICPTGESDNQVSSDASMKFQDEVRVAIPIETVALDDYFSGMRDTSIDFVKIDIQGGELSALKGMQRLLSRNRGIRVMAEFAPHMPLWKGSDPRELLSLMRSLDFEILDLADHASRPVTDDELVAKYIGTGAMTNLFFRRP